MQAGVQAGLGAPGRAHTEPVDAATEMLSSGQRREAARPSPPFPILRPAYTSSGPNWNLPSDSLEWHKAM